MQKHSLLMDTATVGSRTRKGSVYINDWVINLSTEVKQEAQCLFRHLIKGNQRHINSIFIIWKFQCRSGSPQ